MQRDILLLTEMIDAAEQAQHWSVVVTYRGPRVRIISACRSRKEEVALYEG